MTGHATARMGEAEFESHCLLWQDDAVVNPHFIAEARRARGREETLEAALRKIAERSPRRQIRDPRAWARKIAAAALESKP